jgi:O-antigen/teichoic acid export membrane protein
LLKKLFKESLVYGLSRYITKFIGVFLLPLYTAVLVPEDYGILDLLGTITIVSSFLIISGTDSALSYYFYRKEHIEERPVMIASSLWIRIFFSAAALTLIIIFSGVISDILFGRNYRLFIIITGITILFSSVFSFLIDLLRFEFRPWLYTIISSGGILVNILLTIYYVLILKQGVYGALMASSIAYFLFFIATVYYVFKRYGFRFSTLWIKRILKYGFPLIGSGIAIWILNSADRYFLAHYVDLSSVGIYAVGMKLANFLGMVGGALQLAWGPFALNIQYSDDAKKIYAKVFLIFFVLNIVGIFAISIFSIDILKVFTQPNYYSAKAVVPFLCSSTVFSMGYFIAAIGINITKKLQHTVWITLSAAALNILLNFFLTPAFGVIGAAFSIMVANLLILILSYKISQKFYFIPFNYGKILAFAVPAAILIAVSYYFDLKIVPRIILSFLYFIFTAIFLYKSFKNTEDFKKLIKYLSRIRQKKVSEPDTADINL